MRLYICSEEEKKRINRYLDEVKWSLEGSNLRIGLRNKLFGNCDMVQEIIANFDELRPDKVESQEDDEDG